MMWLLEILIQTNDSMDYDEKGIDWGLVWDILKWFVGGVSALVGILLTALFGRIYTQHYELYKWYIGSTDAEKIKLKDTIIASQKQSMEKMFQDMSELKHQFNNFATWARPLLERYAAQEEDVVEQLEKMGSKFTEANESHLRAFEELKRLMVNGTHAR